MEGGGPPCIAWSASGSSKLELESKVPAAKLSAPKHVLVFLGQLCRLCHCFERLKWVVLTYSTLHYPSGGTTATGKGSSWVSVVSAVWRAQNCSAALQSCFVVGLLVLCEFLLWSSTFSSDFIWRCYLEKRGTLRTPRLPRTWGCNLWTLLGCSAFSSLKDKRILI